MFHQSKFRVAFFTFVLTASSGLSMLATAQQEGYQEPAAAPSAGNIDDKKVEKFIDAYVQVQEINQEYSESLQKIDKPEKANELHKEVQVEMKNTIEEEGLSVEEYQSIFQMVANDPELRAKVEERLK